MRKTEEAAAEVSDRTCEMLTPADISAMLAEAAAVDALFERMRRGAFAISHQLVHRVSFAPPIKTPNPIPAV